MAEYSNWKPVLNPEQLNQDRRKRALFGRDPKESDPYVSDAYMVARPTPNTRLNLPASTPNPVAVGIAKMQPADPTNVPVSPEDVRQAQDGVSGVTGIQASPGLGFNDKLLQQDLQDKRAWTASTTDAPGTATVAGAPVTQQSAYSYPQDVAIGASIGAATLGTGMGISALRNAKALRAATSAGVGPSGLAGAAEARAAAQAAQAAPIAQAAPAAIGRALLKSGAGIGLLLTPNDSIASQAEEDAELAAYASGKRASPGSAENRELRDKSLASDPVPKVAIPDSAQNAGASPNFIARATDVLPQTQNSGAAPGVSPSEEQIAQARRDAQLAPTDYTPLNDRLASLNAGIEAQRDLARTKANIADGFAPDTDRSKMDSVTVVGNPSLDEAAKDYAAGRVGSTGYGMIRALKMDQEQAANNVARQQSGRRGRGGVPGLQLPSDSGHSSDTGLKDALAVLQYNRGLRSDQQRYAQNQIENALNAARLVQQGEIAQRTYERAQRTEDRAAAAAHSKQFAEDAKVQMDSLPKELGWAAPLATRYYSEAEGKFGRAAEATQALGLVTGALAQDQNKEFKYKDGEVYSNADAVAMAQGTYDGWSGMKQVDREARQAAAREYLMRRALEVGHGR